MPELGWRGRGDIFLGSRGAAPVIGCDLGVDGEFTEDR